ncbi:MAG: type IX secretion system sortase PorU [Bacteroidales bacterium]
MSTILRFFSLLLVVLVFQTLLLGQEVAVNKQINLNWLGIRTFGDTLDPSHRFLYFSGAQFQPESSDLPLYYESLPLADNEEVTDIQILNPVYTSLLPEELGIIRDATEISSSLLVSHSLSVQRNQASAIISILPFRKDELTSSIQRLENFTLAVTKRIKENKSPAKELSYSDHSVLAHGNWYKLGVKNTGIYKLTYQELQAMGITLSSVNPHNIRIYGNGGGVLPEANNKFRHDDLQENAIQIVGEEDGSFDQADYILFYAESADSWTYIPDKQKFAHTKNYYSDYSYYFLTTDLGPGKRIQDLASVTQPATHQVSRFNDYAFHNKDSLNLIKSGKVWYGEKFDLKLTYDLPVFNFPDIDGDTPLRMDVDLAARSTASSTFKVYVNNGEAVSQSIMPISPAFNTDYAITANTFRVFYVNNPQMNVRVTYLPPVSGSVGFLNFIEFNVTRHLIMSGDQMGFRNITTIGPGNISEFTLQNAGSGVSIWDVTDRLNIKKIMAQNSGNNMIFRQPTDSLKEYFAFTGGAFHTISDWSAVSNQDLHGIGPQDMIIIAASEFNSQAEELADIHRDEGLKVVVVNPSEIFNEFSSGKQDISALRDFVRMIYQRSPAGQELRYLLMFGDGSYDYKNRMPDNTNFVPTFQSYNSLRPTESYVTDDFFGLMDNNEGQDAAGTLDLGVGRLPVVNAEEADDALYKIKRYLGLVPQTPGTNYASNIPRLGDWRNMICFVADDEDNNMHIDQAEDLSGYVDTAFRQYNIDKIYFDAYKQVSTPGGQRFPDVTSDVNKRMGKGALIVNYTGHGGETGWAHERVLEVTDINAWSNKWDLPVFVTATCEFSRFDDPERVSAGEYVFLNKEGGGISLFTTTRLSFSSSNFALNLNFYYSVFDKIDGKFLKMGDVIMRAKTPSNPNIRNFVLLGDPAIGIAYPQYQVATSSINGKPVGQEPDTIRAFSNVTVTGFIQDDNGNKLTDFNGTLYPTVFDKPSDVTTLGNDPESYKRTFGVQKNILYKGKVSVVNGDFTFSFIVPRDIAYKYGIGKISYYAQNGFTDANGFYENLIIGGSETVFEPDNSGPAIELFMNDTLFRYGGITDQNPVLLAFVSDEHGINTMGNGIGHDIVAVLDEDTEKSIVLNDYYEADLDSYQSGVVRYPFFNLTEGLHNLRVKIWDIYNNSSEAYTEFYVIGNERLVLENLLNYPNPFIDHTSFIFNYNQPGSTLDVEIQIFSVMGQLIKTIKEQMTTDGFKVGPIRWDGYNDYGSRIGRGLYVYRVRVTTDKGESVEKTSKLIVLK